MLYAGTIFYLTGNSTLAVGYDTRRGVMLSYVWGTRNPY